jgi:hypothetical protein
MEVHVDAGLLRELRALADSPDHSFRPIEDDEGRASGALNWYVLIKSMEEFRRVTGNPLTDAWEHVHRAEYHEAISVFDVVVERWRRSRSARHR